MGSHFADEKITRSQHQTPSLSDSELPVIFPPPLGPHIPSWTPKSCLSMKGLSPPTTLPRPCDRTPPHIQPQPIRVAARQTRCYWAGVASVTRNVRLTKPTPGSASHLVPITPLTAHVSCLPGRPGGAWEEMPSGRGGPSPADGGGAVVRWLMRTHAAPSSVVARSGSQVQSRAE